MHQLGFVFFKYFLEVFQVCAVYLVMLQLFCLYRLQQVSGTWVEVFMGYNMGFMR